jgi:hypothetical protein
METADCMISMAHWVGCALILLDPLWISAYKEAIKASMAPSFTRNLLKNLDSFPYVVEQEVCT